MPRTIGARPSSKSPRSTDYGLGQFPHHRPFAEMDSSLPIPCSSALPLFPAISPPFLQSLEKLWGTLMIRPSETKLSCEAASTIETEAVEDEDTYCVRVAGWPQRQQAQSLAECGTRLRGQFCHLRRGKV